MEFKQASLAARNTPLTRFGDDTVMSDSPIGASKAETFRLGPIYSAG